VTWQGIALMCKHFRRQFETYFHISLQPRNYYTHCQIHLSRMLTRGYAKNPNPPQW